MIAHSMTFDGNFADVTEKVIAALADEGFGIITRIDMHDAFAEKLGVDFHKYTILGACNPKLAHTAISAVPEVGLLLPCNVTVEEVEGGIRVCTPDAQQLLTGTGVPSSPVLQELADDASARLDRVATALGG